MAGIRIVIPSSFTDNTLPVLREDPILPKAGALYLIEPTHTVSPWSAGVPANEALLPNVAKTQAEALLGVGNTNATFYRSANFSGNIGFMERSAKGGLHSIATQTNDVANAGGSIRYSQAFNNYLYANQDHEYFFSLWSRVTRPPASAIEFISQVGSGNGSTDLAITVHEQVNSRTYPTSAPGVTHRREAVPRGVNGEALVNMANKAWKTAPTSSSFTAAAAVFSNGTGVQNNRLNQHASWIFYRMYVEDLTVSGRTAAQVDAIDNELYLRQVMTPGGRYYGDTFTSPSTLP